MKRIIPIYDDTAPVACTISDAEVPERVALLERLRSALTDVEATEHGLLLRLLDDDAVEADARTFAVDEKRCCQFWGFGVERTTGAVTLRWDAPPSARDLLDQLEAWLRGHDSPDALRGLL